MRPEDVLVWLRAQPFAPFRITMNSGRTYEVRHPEMARLMRTSMMLFAPGPQPDLFDHAEMIGLVLIERIEPLTGQPAASSGVETAPEGQARE